MTVRPASVRSYGSGYGSTKSRSSAVDTEVVCPTSVPHDYGGTTSISTAVAMKIRRASVLQRVWKYA
eukprot:3914958-Rhodomonas_salina.1